MENKESRVMGKSDLLYLEIVLDFIKKVEDVKTYLIYAAAGKIETFDGGAIEYLSNLNDLQDHLSYLANNVEHELITFDCEKFDKKVDND